MKIHQLTQHLARFTACTLLVGATGCASIVDGGRKTVSIRSVPPDARVTVYDKRGEQIAVQQTPAIFTLKRGGSYSTERYRLVLEKPGYEPVELEVKSRLNSWYFGNLVFGGLLGLLIVDPMTGAMWTLSPREIDQTLQGEMTTFIEEDGSLYVMLRRDVPEHLADSLIPVPMP